MIPTVLYPTLTRGVIDGPIRCESIDGTELWLPPIQGIIVMAPFQKAGKIFGVSHLQKKASFFSLKFEPFSYHFGYFWHLQEQDLRGNWVPGTEKGLYFRTPGWRWQVPDAVSAGTPWVWSNGYVGGHLD